MKRYEFHSALPPEEVFARLNTRAKAERTIDPWTGKDLFLFHRKSERFWLFYTGRYLVRGARSFRGRVAPEGGGSLITGTFAPDPRGTLVLAALCFFSMVLLRFPPVAAVCFSAVAFVWFAVVERLIQLPFRGRQKAVLQFIEDNLLN